MWCMRSYRFVVASFAFCMSSLFGLVAPAVAQTIGIGPWQHQPMGEILRYDFPGNYGQA